MAEALQLDETTKGEIGATILDSILERDGFVPFRPAMARGPDRIFFRADVGMISVESKARNIDKDGFLNFEVEVLKPNPRHYIFLVSLREQQDFWVIPSMDFVKLANLDGRGQYRLKIGRENSPSRERLQPYYRNKGLFALPGRSFRIAKVQIRETREWSQEEDAKLLEIFKEVGTVRGATRQFLSTNQDFSEDSVRSRLKRLLKKAKS